MTGEAITMNHLTMRYGEHTALDNVSLTLERGKIYGLLGRNGAGKTTLINLITNRLIPTGGGVTIDGEAAVENDEAQSKVYAMGETAYLPDDAKVLGLYQWVKAFYPGFDMAYALSLSEKFRLPLKKRIRNLSTGYATICKLIAALATDVPYVLLDEPVLGLDANHRDLFYRELLANFGKNPRTFVLSTHLIEEIAGLIEQVVVLHGGKVLLDKPAEEVKRMGYGISGRAEAVDAYCAGRDPLSVETLGGMKMASLLGRPEDVPADLQVRPLELQQLFVKLTDAQEEA